MHVYAIPSCCLLAESVGAISCALEVSLVVSNLAVLFARINCIARISCLWPCCRLQSWLFEPCWFWQATSKVEPGRGAVETPDKMHKEEEGCSSSHRRYSKSQSLKSAGEAHAKSTRVVERSGKAHKMDEGNCGADGLGATVSAHRSRAAGSRRSDEKQAVSFPPDMGEFHTKVRVGAMIEAEMDDTKGSTEWVVGQVQSVNAARATFTVKFTVQSDTETGEWIDNYRWEELGREWRFARQKIKLESTRDHKSERRRVSGDHAGGIDISDDVDMLPAAVDMVGSDNFDTNPAACDEDGVGAVPDEKMVASRVRPGVAIEAEMDDSYGGTEWIRGVVISTKSKARSFKVQFKVKNDDESGEWTDEYR